jgi:uncharacterized membrane protein YoaK (UPF0700 family)
MNRVALALFLIFRFAIEICFLIAIGYWGWRQGFSLAERIGLAAAAVFVTAVVWGVFVSPKARVRLPENLRLTVELLVVAAAVAALRATGRVRPALLLGVAGVMVGVLNSLWRRLDERGEAS